jgi:hypothetical protein
MTFQLNTIEEAIEEIQNGKVTISEFKYGTYFVRFLKDGKVYQEKITKL